MWNTPSKKRLCQIPALYSTEHQALSEKLIYLHFFLGNSDWYVCEFNGQDTFWGFVILNGDLLNAEWGYFTLRKLDQLNVRNVEIDCEHEDYWQIRPAGDVNKISQAQRWNQQQSLNQFNRNSVKSI